MQPTGGSVAAFIAGVTPPRRQRDAETLVALMGEISGREPELWGTIVGFGACHYRYPTGTEGDMPLLAFAPRKTSSTVYLDDTGAHTEALAKLGPHTIGASCLYVKDLDQVDAAVLRGILEASYTATSAGGASGVEITVTN
jgi:hypothetical protein